jgi:hypothetical protein
MIPHTLSPIEKAEKNNFIRWVAHPVRLDVAVSNQGHTVTFPIVANRDIFLRANRKQRRVAIAKFKSIRSTRKNNYRLCPIL